MSVSEYMLTDTPQAQRWRRAAALCSCQQQFFSLQLGYTASGTVLMPPRNLSDAGTVSQMHGFDGPAAQPSQ